MKNDKIKASEARCIDWKRLFTSLFNDVNYTVTDAEVIIITDRQFLEKRCEIYAQYMTSTEKIKVVHDTAIWKLLWNTEQFMPSSVRKAHEMYDQAMSALMPPLLIFINNLASLH
ncbi:hypothetical protein ACTXT7_013614 [Hymenolepis weldensis]